MQLFKIPALLFAAIPLLVEAQAVRDKYVEAELIPEQSHVIPGQPIRIALRLQHDSHWHTYWKTTATGYATSIEWDLPEGFIAGEIEWPAPRPYEFEGWVEYVYEGSVLLPVTIQIPQDAQPGTEITFKATAEWLMCEKVCIPGKANLQLTLPVASSAQPAHEELWSAYRELIPHKAPPGLTAWRTDDQIFLQLPDDITETDLSFFDEQTLVKPQAKQPIRKLPSGERELIFAVDEAGVGEADRFIGVLKADNGFAALGSAIAIQIDLPLLNQPPVELASPPPVQSWFAMLALAFAGGLILNLMPCVFPVLGIKVMGFVGQAGQHRSRIIAHGLLFTLGVLLSFWLLAAVLLILRSGGEQLGWGFQLQSPAFVFILTVFLFLFALNMSGLFEVGQSAVGVGSQLTAKPGLSGSFFSGILATVVATPCAAPFLAPALGAALTLPAFHSLLVFTAIALGLATPYLLFSLFPGLVRLLPKPGAWMETFKQAMSFLLYATVGYLIWVLVGQLTEEAGYTSFAFLAVTFSLVLAAAAAWVYGRWALFHRPRKTRWSASVTSAIILLIAVWLGYPKPAFFGDASGEPLVWEQWSPGKAEQLQAEGKIVYVDFTARWCVTCQTNKAAVFSSKLVRNFIRDEGVILLKADWTQQNPEITAALAAYDRSAVPFNLVFGPATPEPAILPEILTPNTVLNAMARVR